MKVVDVNRICIKSLKGRFQMEFFNGFILVNPEEVYKKIHFGSLSEKVLEVESYREAAKAVLCLEEVMDKQFVFTHSVSNRDFFIDVDFARKKGVSEETIRRWSREMLLKIAA